MYKTYVFDLDKTICIPQDFDDTDRRYAMAKPIPEMIEFVQEVHRNGHRVVIHTARRMLTHKGNMQLIEDDVGQVTRNWLIVHKVPFDELVFGKPFGDFYIDDKAVNAYELLDQLRNT